jgi:hypothetical protein
MNAYFATYFVPYFRTVFANQSNESLNLSTFPVRVCTCSLCNLEDLDVAHVEKTLALTDLLPAMVLHTLHTLHTQPMFR